MAKLINKKISEGEIASYRFFEWSLVVLCNCVLGCCEGSLA